MTDDPHDEARQTAHDLQDTVREASDLASDTLAQADSTAQAVDHASEAVDDAMSSLQLAMSELSEAAGSRGRTGSAEGAVDTADATVDLLARAEEMNDALIEAVERLSESPAGEATEVEADLMGRRVAITLTDVGPAHDGWPATVESALSRQDVTVQNLADETNIPRSRVADLLDGSEEPNDEERAAINAALGLDSPVEESDEPSLGDLFG